MVKRKTVRTVYKKSRRKSIKRISRKTKGGGKKSKKGIRTFKKKHSKKIKRTKKRKLKIQIRNNYIHVNKTVRIGNFKLRPGNKLNFLPQDRKYQEGGMSKLRSFFGKGKKEVEVCIPETMLHELEVCCDAESLIPNPPTVKVKGKGKAKAKATPYTKKAFDQEFVAMKDWKPIDGGDMLVTNENCQELERGNILGQGASGVVFQATFKGEEVAVKELNFTENDIHKLRSVVKEFKAEVEIMSKLTHLNLVQIKGYCTSGIGYKFKVVLELISGGTLYDKLQDYERSFDPKELLQYALDVAMGMEYLHSFEPPILHRDLKSLNIMVGKTDNDEDILKITDFGLARMKGVDGDMKTQVMTQAGTPYWQAPEVLRGAHYNESADVYSTAVVFYEIWARKVPYKGLSPMEASVQVTMKSGDGEGEFMRPNLEADSIKVAQPCPIIDLVKKMWDDDPKLRPTFFQICDSIVKTAKDMEPSIILRDNRANAQEVEFDW